LKSINFASNNTNRISHVFDGFYLVAILNKNGIEIVVV